MQQLSQLNIHVRPLSRTNFDDAIKVIVDAYSDHPVITDKVYTKQEFIDKTQALMNQVLKAQEKLNQQLNTSRTYSSVYYLEGNIVAVLMMCDFDKFLKIVEKHPDEIAFKPLAHLNQTPFIKHYNVYSGRSVIIKQMQSLGIAKYLLMQRMEHFHKYGYQNVIAIASNVPSYKVWLRVGASLINDSVYVEQKNGSKFKLTLLKNSIKDFMAKRGNPNQIYAKL